MAMNQKRLDLAIGYMPNQTIAASTFALNAAANWIAFSFNAQSAKTLNLVRLYCTGVTGVLGANDITCTLYSDVGGSPSAIIEVRNTVTATPTGASWVEWTGFTTLLVIGTRYWLVFKNVNALPATNFPTYISPTNCTNTGQTSIGSSTTSTVNAYGWDSQTTVNSGGVWNFSAHNCMGPRLQYSDNTYEGFPTQNTATVDTTTTNRQFGFYCVTGNVSIVVAGLAFICHSTAAPSSNLVMKLYQGTTLLGTTVAIPLTYLNVTAGSSWATAFFSSPITVPPNAIIRAVIASAGNDTSAYNLPYYTLQNDANSFALMPFQGTYRKTVTADNGASFTENQTLICAGALILDQASEFLFSGMMPIDSPVIIPPFRTVGF